MNAVSCEYSPLVRAVHEVMESLVAPARCVRVLELALARSGLTAIPAHSGSLNQWVRTSLAPEVRRVAGADAADLLVSQLSNITHGMEVPAAPALPNAHLRAQKSLALGSDGPSSTVRPLSRIMTSAHASGDVISPPPPEYSVDDYLEVCEIEEAQQVGMAPEEKTPTGIVPLVPHTTQPHLRERQAPHPLESKTTHIRCRLLIASADKQSVKVLQDRFGEALEVEHVNGIGELLDLAPNASESERVALILDCRRPTMHPASVAGLAEELPYGLWVVAWGLDVLMWDELEPDRAGPMHWVRCAAEAQWHDVMGLANTLLAAGPWH